MKLRIGKSESMYNMYFQLTLFGGCDKADKWRAGLDPKDQRLLDRYIKTHIKDDKENTVEAVETVVETINEPAVVQTIHEFKEN